MIELLAPYRKLDNKKRYTLVTGGRGSGKSFHLNVFILFLTYNEGEVILFTRYTMTSAERSIIPEFKHKMELFGVEDDFTITKTEIINKHSESKILFSGIKTSSGNQTANLKSLTGLTCWVLDEAEELYNEDEFNKIARSVRTKGVQNRIILSMNPTDIDHWIYKRFIEKGEQSNTEYIHTTYMDNLNNLDEGFINEAELLKENNPEQYKREFLGEWGSMHDKVFPKGFEVVEDMPSEYDWKVYGGDFGYTNDPTAIVEVRKTGNCLYLREWCYQRGMLNPDIANFMNNFGLVDEVSIWDSADGNKSVHELNLGNVPAYGAKKGAGSVYWGIEKIKQYSIFITSNSTNLISEFNQYRWAKNPDGTYKRNAKGQKIPYVANPPKDHLLDAVRYAVSYYEEIVIEEK